MAKMFYSLTEAADRLGKSEDDVREMVSRGEIQEFLSGDDHVFKVEQIDLLAGDEDAGDFGMIPLVDSSEGSALGLVDSSSESALGGSVGGGSGISVFDADELEEADPSAQTQMTADGGGDLESVSLESFGSGSGLMDLTRESDDTSLGADGLLDDLYSGDEAGAGEALGGADLFEGAAVAEGLAEAEGAAPAPAAVEFVDGRGSGLVGGLAVGVVATLGLGIAVGLMGVMGVTPGVFGEMFGGNMLIWMGILLGGTLVIGGIGFALGGRG